MIFLNKYYKAAGGIDLEILEIKSHILLKKNLFFANLAVNTAALIILFRDFFVVEENIFIKNYCSSITPHQRDSGVNPKKGVGVALFPFFAKSTSFQARVFLKNCSFLENFALSKG